MKNSVARFEPTKKYEHIPITNNLPLAIGAQYHDDPINRSTQRKSHNLLLNRYIEHTPHTEYNYSGLPRHKNSTQANRPSFLENKEESKAKAEPEIWDGWFSEALTKEDESEFVVRMLGYFIETITESPTEAERVRKVIIKYFVRDDSISITEQKVLNNGIDQKMILSRRRVPKSNNSSNSVILLNDFHIGETVSIYGQEYHIVDMDKRSRRYFEEVLHQTVPSALCIPEDEYGRVQCEKMEKSTKRAITSDDMDRKRVIEQQLTGIYTKHSNEDIVIAKQFLQNRINEHLTFLALWDDRGNISGDLHFCVIRIFLENYAIEVAENRPENSGRSGGTILISKQRIPRPGTDISKSRYQEHTYGKLMKSDYLCPEDFRIGEAYNIFGKPFYIYDCDAATRKYIKEHFNIQLNPAVDIQPLIEEENKGLFFTSSPGDHGCNNENAESELPEYLKISEENTSNDRKLRKGIMNFAARLAKPLVKGDEGREFVITFYCETEELEIQERARRNTGFIGGRFLAKGKHKKELPNGTFEPFASTDFRVGKIVSIYSRPFELTEMDECTRCMLEGKDNLITEEKIKDYILSLKKQIRLKYETPKEAFKALAPQGTLGYRQIKEFMRSCSNDITDDEAILIIQNLSLGNKGVILYDEFLQIQNASEGTMDGAALSSKSIGEVKIDLNSVFKDAANAADYKYRRRVLQTLLQQKLIQRKVSGNTLQEQFRSFAEYSSTCRMNREAFRRSLNELMHFNVPKKDEDILVSLMFDKFENEAGEVTFPRFQEFVDCLEDL